MRAVKKQKLDKLLLSMAASIAKTDPQRAAVVLMREYRRLWLRDGSKEGA